MAYNYTKTVTYTFTIKHVAIDFMVNDENFRRIRSGAKYKCKTCHICNRKFEDNEKISLALTTKGPNRVLCKKCALKVKEELDNEM